MKSNDEGVMSNLFEKHIKRHSPLPRDTESTKE